MTNPARSPRFLDQVEDSAQLAMGAKIQIWGGPETGKSHDAYENLPRPLIVVDSDVSAGLFNDDRFEGFKRLGPDKIPDLETLVAFLDEFTSDPRWYRSYKSLLIDSLTQFVDPKVAELGIDNSSAAPTAHVEELQGASRSRAIAEQGRAQADWARIAKELTRLIRKVSALGVHIYVVAEERTKFVGNRPGDGEDGAKSSLSPKKFTHAFDLIVQKTSRSDVIVRKSRYRAWGKDQKVSGYDAARDLAPILGGAAPKVAGLDDFDPATTAHEELMELLRTLGSDARGGRIPLAKMRQYLAVAKDNAAPDAEVRKVLADVKKSYGDAGTRAA
ncbi:MAG TPA: AAA family ATPase [Gemmatimonadaceae bacterium]|nr:AAA family ATPase [Gemmatimonadaceae bacterium]